VDKITQDILVRFESRIEAIADEIADATVTEVTAFGPMTDDRLRAEVRALARGQLDGFLRATRAGARPDAGTLAAVRDRAATRARQLVPLAAMLHSFMIAQRVISAAIAREAGPSARTRGAALALTALTFDFNIAVTTAMADAYVEAVQGDLADLDWARRVLIDTLLAGQEAATPDLSRRAIGLGLHPGHQHVVALVTFPATAPDQAWTNSQRRLVQALARDTTRTERQIFVVNLGTELLTVLDASARRSPASHACVTATTPHAAPCATPPPDGPSCKPPTTCAYSTSSPPPAATTPTSSSRPPCVKPLLTPSSGRPCKPGSTTTSTSRPPPRPSACTPTPSGTGYAGSPSSPATTLTTSRTSSNCTAPPGSSTTPSAEGTRQINGRFRGSAL
jgi:hypothetical protein